VQYVADLSARDVDGYIQFLSSKPALQSFRNGTTKPIGHVLAPMTVRSYVNNLRTVFSMARRWKYCTENPFTDVPLPKVERPRPRTYGVEEIRVILGATAQHAPECLDIFLVYLLTGMRSGEALRLEWHDVLFVEGIIVLHKTKGKKVRYVPMGPIVRRVFESRREMAKPFGEFWNTRCNHACTFTTDYVGRQWRRMAALAGVPNAQLKRTRGTYATALLEVANISPLGVQAIVGHADIATTQQYYFNPLSEDIMRKVPAIDAMFEEILPAKWITNG
jgi:integrase/recombinase XerC